MFEDTRASGLRQLKIREDSLPLTTLPEFPEPLSGLGLFMHTPGPLTNMVMYKARDRFSELLQPEALADAYEDVIRLLFARSMTEIQYRISHI